MNGYKAFFNGKELDVYANSLLEAKTKALAAFKPAKSKAHMVHVHLCEKAGETVTHIATE
jgi:hypothetical protein